VVRPLPTILPIWTRDVPIAANVLIKSSIETDRSALSNLAILDWLEPTSLASLSCEIRFARRTDLTFIAKATFIFTSIISDSERPRNSSTDPTFQPAASSFFFFDALIGRRRAA